MRKLKNALKAVCIFMFGGLLQNKDNNYSIQNQMENEALTVELNMCHSINLVNNQLETFDKIKQYVTKMDKISSDEEQRKRAADAYIKYREAGFIGEDCRLLKGVDEAITEYIS